MLAQLCNLQQEHQKGSHLFLYQLKLFLDTLQLLLKQQNLIPYRFNEGQNHIKNTLSRVPYPRTGLALAVHVLGMT
jgi:hypothetical protein